MAGRAAIGGSRSQRRMDNTKHDFSWMDRGCQGSEYVSYSHLSELPSCSFDFGNDGYAASSNYGGELLQMTAPSDNHGMVFARGDFEYSLYLALARGQKQKGGKSAFGLKVVTPDQPAGRRGGPVYQPCCMTERGCFNYRWPFNEYCLHIDHPRFTATETPTNPSYCFCPADCSSAREERSKVISDPIGSYSILSFIKDGVLYQVLRLSPRLPVGIIAKKSALVLTVEPPMRLQSFRHLQAEDSQKYQVGLRACAKHTKNGEACVSQLLPMTTEDDPRLPKSDIHWQAKLFKIDNEKPEPTVIKLEPAKAKQDHVFKINDGFDSLPSFQASLDLAVDTAHVFVATFRLFEEGQPVAMVPPLSVSHDVISEFVRKGEQDAPGTASMWQTIFDDRQDRMESVPELCEGSIIGRCLEKILRVDLVPATIRRRPPLPPLRHFTIVSNMFLKANVELKSLFWKMRFLVKVDQLLSKHVQDRGGIYAQNFQSQREYDKPMMESKSSPLHCVGSDGNIITAEATVKRIRYVVGETVAYIMEALVKPALYTPVLLPELRFGDPGHFYAMLTLLYIVQNYPRAKWPWQNAAGDNDIEIHVDAEDSNFGVLDERLPNRQENITFYGSHPTTRVKFSLLEWLHHESVFTLQTKFASSQVIPAQWQVSEQKVKELRYVAKLELVKRIASAEPYRSDDEIADRLVSLAEEVWGPDHDTVKQLMGRVIKRVVDRELTHQIDLCRSSRVKEGTDDGPWELHALCHHSRLVVARRKLCSSPAGSSADRKEAEMEVEHYRKKFYPFLTSEASLTPCWERNNLAARRGFLRSEATAVLASTLIDIFVQDLEFYQGQNVGTQAPPGASAPLSAPNIMVNGGSVLDVADYSQGRPPEASAISLVGRRSSISSIRHLRRAEEPLGVKGQEQYINYLKFMPPRKYHPVEFFNSLDDTPEMYSNEGIAKREVSFPAGIRKALSRQQLPSEDKARKGTGHTPDSLKAFKDLKTNMGANVDTTNRLRDLLVGRVGNTLALGGPGCSQWDIEASEASRLLFESEMTIIDLKTPDSQMSTARPTPIRYKDIVGVISDSLVDQEVCHRFLLARAASDLPPGLLRLFVHVLHPEMMDCFNNHHHRIPRFGLSVRQETIVLHITLRSWSLRQEVSKAVAAPPPRHFGRTPTDMARKVAGLVRRWTPRPNRWDDVERDRNNLAIPGDKKSYQESRISIPDNLARVLAGRNPPTPMELKVSSIGMSTNEFGDFSKCSIITELLELDEIEQLGQRAQKVWDGFTHQPQTGRFLVFSLVLALVTQGIVRDYNLIIDDFLKHTELEKQMPSYLGDPERLQQKDADAELRLSLWSLEALNKLSNTVSTSVRTISNAMAEIASEVSKGPGKRSPELEAVCRNYMEVLERGFSDLTAIQTRLGRKVELSNRYSSALSAVLTLRASRDSYTQNNTIQKLTYLTIGCLPIGLTAAVFAVPEEQLVIPKGTGKEWFIGTVLISFVVIFFIAYFLDSLLGFLRWMAERAGGWRGAKTSPPTLPT